MIENGYILALKEVPLHPNSYILRLEENFEKPSIVHIYGKDGLKGYTAPPVYDDRYLIIFETPSALESNLAYIKFAIMFPVVICSSKGDLENVKYLCRDKKVPFKVFENKFEKEDGIDMIRELAKSKVSDSFCKSLISRVGLSPKRIVSAMTILENVGYTSSNISKYTDKYSYTDIYEVIELLLDIRKSSSHEKRVFLYLHQNRLWYEKYTKKSLLKEIDLLLKLYNDITVGELCEYTLHSYIEREKVSRYRALYAVELYEKVAHSKLMALRLFIEKSSLLELVMRLQ